MEKTEAQRHFAQANAKAETERRRRRILSSIIDSSTLEFSDKVFLLDKVYSNNFFKKD